VRRPVETVKKELIVVDLYPRVPNPIVVDIICVSKNEVLTKFKRLGVDTKLNRLGLEIKPNKFGVEM
jgi:hypothetical protein